MIARKSAASRRRLMIRFENRKADFIDCFIWQAEDGFIGFRVESGGGSG